MAGTRTNRLARHICASLPGPAEDCATDALLLEHYVGSRDARSFAAIVDRHGPLVWGVCRRLLADHQDAEDAFQATFLVLVRKAATVVPRHMVGSWLHGVARRTALKARAVAVRRREREGPATDLPEREVTGPEPWADVRAVIDEELARLPGRYRAVVLLCDLEGKTRAQAARQLGVPAGTVAGWLWRGRGLLARRLTRRGVCLSGASLATALVQYEAAAKVPASVASETVEVAASSLASRIVRPPVATLTQGVLHSMLLSKLKAALTVLVAASLLGTVVTGLAVHATAGEEPKPKPKAGPESKAGQPAGASAGDPPDLRKLKQDVDRLRADLDALKKQVSVAPKSAPAPGDDAEAVLTIRIYPVAELMGDGSKDDSLVRVITNTVRPATWSREGGPGTIEYFAAGKSLVVNQTEAVHTQIDKLLVELIKVKETQNATRQPKK